MIVTPVINIVDAPKGWERDPQFVYIGRPGKGHNGYFGNPIRLAKGEPRGATIERFRAYAEARRSRDWEFRSSLADLHGKTLVCFCKPSPCHGDVLAELSRLDPDA